MNPKTICSVVIAICAAILSACASTMPTATASDSSSASTISTASASNDATPIIPNTSSDSSWTLACSAGSTSASVTPELTEGPYYKEGSPEQTDLYQTGMTGTKLVIAGYVYDANCRPVANAWLDFWQADANGNYDNSGYRLRGHQFTDANGRYKLTTVVPGLYPGRTEHIHVKVQAPNGKLLTTQLFFPGVTQNDSDGIFNQGLLLNIQESSDGLQGQFNFVVPG